VSNPVQDLFQLDGKVALITGGSRGLGLQIAEALGEAQARLLITSRKTTELEAAVSKLKAKGITADWIAADVSDSEQSRKIVATAIARFGAIDILINNAGTSWGAPAEDHTLEAWDKIMSLNTRSVFVLSQAAARASMIPRRSGRIINVASIAGFGGNPPEMTTIAYNTSKGALINFTRALAAEWGKYGITVNALAPGFFPSKMSKGLLDQWGVDNVASHAPLKRLGDDADLKGAALLFASAAGKHITGQILAVDGGVSCVVGG
jgi:NAD(P)-dependent dehydrogenase (short-subunit alcohol dehydrogenase family)